MKTIQIAYSFFKDNLIPILIVLLTLTIVLFMLISVSAQYRYVTYTKSFFENSTTLNNAYYCSFYLGGDEDNMSEDNYLIYKQNVMETMKSFPAFGYTITYQTIRSELILNDYRNIPLLCFDSNMIINFPLHMSEGRWLSTKSNELEVVVFGDSTHTLSIGDSVTLYNDIQAKVVGRVAYDMIPYFNMSGNIKETESLLRTKETPGMIINSDNLPTQLYQDKLKDSIPTPGWLLCFAEESTKAEQQELLDYLTKYKVVPVATKSLIANSNLQIQEWLSQLLPLPTFLLVIATVSLLSISAIMICRSMGEQSKYYLLGCTKKRSVVTLSVSLTLIFMIPIIINFILANYFPNFLRKETLWDLTYAIVDFYSILPLLCYLTLICAFLVLMPILFYRKYSPLSFYRRNL